MSRTSKDKPSQIYPLEYKFERYRNKENDLVINLLWRFGPDYKLVTTPIEDSIWCFHGPVSINRIKKSLTEEQFSLFSDGNDGPFVLDVKIKQDYFKKFGWKQSK